MRVKDRAKPGREAARSVLDAHVRRRTIKAREAAGYAGATSTLTCNVDFFASVKMTPFTGGTSA